MNKRNRMKVWAAALIIVTVGVIGVSAFLIVQRQNANTVELTLSSDPFPVAVGNTTMRVTLRHSDGTPVPGATIHIDGTMNEPDHPNMIPVHARSSMMSDGVYVVPVTWSMMGRWEVTATADLPDNQAVVTEQYSLIVFPVPQILRGSSLQPWYRSNRQIAAVTTASDEFRLVIPMGTQETMMEGQGNDIIPATIILHLNGQHILVIENDDVTDHIIGPFYVRSGETMRQNFTAPTEIDGVCSFRHDSHLSIIVE